MLLSRGECYALVPNRLRWRWTFSTPVVSMLLPLSRCPSCVFTIFKGRKLWLRRLLQWLLLLLPNLRGIIVGIIHIVRLLNSRGYLEIHLRIVDVFATM